jgi:hypothetical protein
MPPDPYRILGLTRGASLDEVKRAYRRLAKANHPDRAGEGSLARFLEIQDAYDRIEAGMEGGGRSATGGGARRAWDADPGRADATRRAYGSRARRTRPAGGGSGPRTTPPEGAAGDPGTPDGDGSSERRRRGRGDRKPNKATLGSTSYDGAEEGPFEPDWGGASWYGTTTGTYWTLNPKEYADPRKHGPEYQARARRSAEGRADGPEPAAGPAGTPDEPTTERPSSARPAAPTHTTSSWWEATAASAGAAGSAGTSGTASEAAARRPPTSQDPPRRPPPGSATSGTEPIMPALDAARWLDAGRGGIPARVGRAVLGWAPIALGTGWLAGELTGCGRYSAECDAAVAPLAWLAQVVVLAVLLLIPRLATAASVATLVTLAAAVPGALILSASGTDAADTMAPLALGGLLVVGWLTGIVAGLAREVRALRAAPASGAGTSSADATLPPDDPDDRDDPDDGAAPVS